MSNDCTSRDACSRCMQGSAPVAELHDGLMMRVVHSDAITVSLRKHPPPALGGIFNAKS